MLVGKKDHFEHTSMQKAWPVKKKRSSKKIVLALILITSAAAFGYSQYNAVTSISSTIMESQELDITSFGTTYDMQISFTNPSLLMLTAGNTEFTISADGNNIGQGQLDPFYLPALGQGTAYGEYTVYENANEVTGAVKISGTTSYDIYITTINIPFVYYPTSEQQDKFVR